MRDLGGQLADYFDATVERITPEDIIAGNEVRHPSPQLTPRPKRQLRAAWAVGAAFATTIVAIGGSMGVVTLLRARRVPMGSGIGQPVVASGTGGDVGWLWVVLAGLSVGLIVAVAALMVKGRRTRVGANGGTTMTMTTDKPQVDDSVHKLHTTNRVLIVAVVVLALLAIGLGGWAIYQATASDQGTAIPQNVATLLDEWEAANNRADGSVAELYAIAGYHQAGTTIYRGEDIVNQLSAPGYAHEWTTEPYLLVDEGDGRFVVTRGLRIEDPTMVATSVFVFEITTDADGELEFAQTNWIWVH